MSRYSSSQVGSMFRYAVIATLVLQPYTALAHSPVAKSNKVSDPAHSQAQPADVELKQGGVLIGQVVNESGAGVGSSIVELTNGQHTWRAQTDANGWFQITELRGGTYQFQVDGQRQMLRAWSHGTAPPRASQGVLVTPEADVFRGQRVLSPNTNQFFRVAKQRLSNPLVVGGVILTAVAIPVAIHNSDDDPPATP